MVQTELQSTIYREIGVLSTSYGRRMLTVGRQAGRQGSADQAVADEQKKLNVEHLLLTNRKLAQALRGYELISAKIRRT